MYALQCCVVWCTILVLPLSRRHRRRRCRRRFLPLIYMYYGIVRMDFLHYSILFQTFYLIAKHTPEFASRRTNRCERKRKKKEL